MKLILHENKEISRKKVPKIEYGAGILAIAADTNRLLVAKRTSNINNPLTWGIFGGAVGKNEKYEAAAKREFSEEAGYSGSIDLFKLKFIKNPYKTRKGKKKLGHFMVFFGILPSENVSINLNWENDEFRWVTLKELVSLQPKHPILSYLLKDSHVFQLIDRYTV